MYAFINEKYLQHSGFVVLEINILVSTEVQWLPKEYDSSWKSRKELILYSGTKYLYALLKTLSICFSLNARPLDGEKLYSLVFLSMAINRMSSFHCKIYTQIWIELIGP